MLPPLLRCELRRVFRPSGILLKIAAMVGFGAIAHSGPDNGIVAAIFALPIVLYVAGLIGWIDTLEINIAGEPAWTYYASRPLSQRSILAARKVALNAVGALLTGSLVAGLLLGEGEGVATPWFVIVPLTWLSVIVGGLYIRQEWPTGPRSM